MPSIRVLKTFLETARRGSFAAAGQSVGLTAAAVGLQIRALEEELGLELFDRGGRSVSLSPAGREAVAEIEDLVARYDAMVAGARSDEPVGTVMVGALVSTLMGAFADALWSLRKRYPRLEVRLFAGLSSDFALKVERGEMDAAIVTHPPHAMASSLVWTELYAEPMVLIVPRHPHFALPDDPLAVLGACPFIRFDHQTWTGYLVRDALGRAGASVRAEMELNSVEAIIETVRQGFGVSIVPRLANLDWDRDRALRTLVLPGEPVLRRVGLLERTRHRRMAVTEEIKSYFHRRGPVR